MSSRIQNQGATSARCPAEQSRDARAIFKAWKASGPDPALRQKLQDIPDVIESWLSPYGGLAGRDILDFGCGFGETTAGIALGYEPGRVVGVDIQDKPVQCRRILHKHLGVERLPGTLNLRRIEEGETLGEAAYDLVFSWSVLEHVRRATLRRTIANLAIALRPGGLAFIQISPLYFSPEGSHLWAIGYRDWDHLRKQTSEVISDIESAQGLTEGARARLLHLYSTLNRVTAGELRACFEATGMEVLREQLDRTEAVPEASLTEAYSLDALTTFQTVLLLRKPA